MAWTEGSRGRTGPVQGLFLSPVELVAMVYIPLTKYVWKNTNLFFPLEDLVQIFQQAFRKCRLQDDVTTRALPASPVSPTWKAWLPFLLETLLNCRTSVRELVQLNNEHPCIVIFCIHPATYFDGFDPFTAQKTNRKVSFFLGAGCRWNRHFYTTVEPSCAVEASRQHLSANAQTMSFTVVNLQGNCTMLEIFSTLLRFSFDSPS